MLRAMIGSNSAIADIVPVDVCVNMMIAIGWHTAIQPYVVGLDRSG